jgi:hypothetical protein
LRTKFYDKMFSKKVGKRVVGTGHRWGLGSEFYGRVVLYQYTALHVAGLHLNFDLAVFVREFLTVPKAL